MNGWNGGAHERQRQQSWRASSGSHRVGRQGVIVAALTYEDCRRAARRRLPRMLFDYVDGGSYDEITLGLNVSDLRAVRLRQRVLRDVAAPDMGVTWFGRDYAMPVALGPVGFAGALARRGEAQAVRAARAAGVPFCLSTVGICGPEEVATAAGGQFWFQLYMIRDRAFMADLLARVRALEPQALVFTVDLPVAGARYRDARSGMNAPPGWQALRRRVAQAAVRPGWALDVALRGGPLTFGALAGAVPSARSIDQLFPWIAGNMDPSVTWDDLAWVRERWPGPIILKGILDADDARRAIDVGADGVVVSNHGGRQLDGVRSSITALEDVAPAVDGRLPVFLDGGVRTGIDVLRALALGASGCLLGRAWAFALAADGERGVATLLSRLRAELVTAMALTGITRLSEAGPDIHDRGRP